MTEPDERQFFDVTVLETLQLNGRVPARDECDAEDVVQEIRARGDLGTDGGRLQQVSLRREIFTQPAHDQDAPTPPDEVLIRVTWLPASGQWDVEARPAIGQEWVSHQGGESELDSLLSLARDIVTGG